MIKNSQLDLAKLNQELITYVWPGYDLHFLHGWFVAYLSAPSDSEEDLLIPTYLILDESRIENEQQFSKLVDKLVKVYTNLADSIYEQNKLIRPLIDFSKPNTFDPLLFTEEHKHNLLKWLYGYLTGYLAIGGDITEYASNEELLENKFYPALFTLCVALFKLVTDNNISYGSAKMSEDFIELQADLRSMWESEDEEGNVEDVINNAITEVDFADVIGALNDVFYVIRVCDEEKFANDQLKNNLVHKLSSSSH